MNQKKEILIRTEVEMKNTKEMIVYETAAEYFENPFKKNQGFNINQETNVLEFVLAEMSKEEYETIRK